MVLSRVCVPTIRTAFVKSKARNCMRYTIEMKELISPEIRKTLVDSIFPDLKNGRKDFDLPHTIAVVYWMEQILEAVESPDLDPLVMIPAAFAHDWGYVGLFEGVNSNDTAVIKTRKADHMKVGAEKLDQLILNKLWRDISLHQRRDAVHLVRVHDKVEELSTEPELTIMEADTLGMLDSNRVAPTFSKEQNDNFMATDIEKRRVPRFVHEFSKEKARELKEVRKAWYTNKNS